MRYDLGAHIVLRHSNSAHGVLVHCHRYEAPVIIGIGQDSTDAKEYPLHSPSVQEQKSSLRLSRLVAFAIVDHAAPDDTGADFAGQHRIDEALVKQKLLKASFKLEKESNLLRNPNDDRMRPFLARENKGRNTDKFALLFCKPRAAR